MTSKMGVKALLATAAFVATGFVTSASAADVPCATAPSPTNVTSCSTGVSVNLSLLNLVGVAVGPIANAFGTAPAPYNVTSTLASADAGGNFALLGKLGLTTGLITDTASSPYDGSVITLHSTATSTVNNLDLGLKLLGLSVLDVTASTLGSTSTASNTTGLRKSFVGSSYITGLVITAAGASFAGDVTAATPANDDILSVAGLDIIANYQTPILLNGTDQIGIQTAALAIEFDNYEVTSGLLHNVLHGTIYIADSAAAVPEPATWTMMLLGFGLVGVMARQRRGLALA